MKINLSIYSFLLLKPFILSWGTSSCLVSLLLIKACLQEGSNEMMKALPLAVNDQPGSVQGPVCRRQSLLLLPWSKKKIKNKNRPSIERICLCRGFTAGWGEGQLLPESPCSETEAHGCWDSGPMQRPRSGHGLVHICRVHLQYR